MSFDRLVVINDRSAFEVTNALKYFHIFTKFIGLDIAVDSFFQAAQGLRHSLAGIAADCSVGFSQSCRNTKHYSYSGTQCDGWRLVYNPICLRS